MDFTPYIVSVDSCPNSPHFRSSINLSPTIVFNIFLLQYPQPASVCSIDSSLPTALWLNSPESLEWIKLAENHLTDIPSALKNLTRLRLLDVRSNNITHIGKNIFFNFGKTLKYLHLQNNRWVVLKWTTLFIHCVSIRGTHTHIGMIHGLWFRVYANSFWKKNLTVWTNYSLKIVWKKYHFRLGFHKQNKKWNYVYFYMIKHRLLNGIRLVLYHWYYQSSVILNEYYSYYDAHTI